MSIKQLKTNLRRPREALTVPQTDHSFVIASGGWAQCTSVDDFNFDTEGASRHTIGFWIKMPNNPGVLRTILWRSGTYSSSPPIYEKAFKILLDGNMRLVFSMGDEYITVSLEDFQMQPDTWYHILMRHDVEGYHNAYLFINGSFVTRFLTSTPVEIENNANPLKIGVGSYLFESAPSKFDGRIYKLAFWNHSLGTQSALQVGTTDMDYRVDSGDYDESQYLTDYYTCLGKDYMLDMKNYSDRINNAGNYSVSASLDTPFN